MFWLFILLTCASAAVPPTCNSGVYCTGPLLHAVQMARIFNDSKSFVDMKMRFPETTVLANFAELEKQTNNSPTHDQLVQFVHDNFEEGDELEVWTPPDFNPNPKFLDRIQDTELRDFARQIVAIWKKLARKVKPEVAEKPNQYSLMYLPHGFIIPGGRFKEIYYWDTYWIIRGLLISEMRDTARGMIENLMHMVKKVGHVPNGSRVYYLQRSQPPLLTKMVRDYMSFTNDTQWLRDHISILDKELDFWITYRQKKVVKDGITYSLYQYNAPSFGPRPESYREDVNSAASTPNPNETYIELKSGAESGWDFSTRWIFDELGGNNANLTSIQTRRAIPVDLNAILYEAFDILSDMYNSLGNIMKATKWRQRATKLRIAINSVLYNEAQGVWQDFDIKLGKHRDFFYVSNIAPLWAGMSSSDSPHTLERVLKYLKKEGIEKYPGGTPTSLIQSGEQWDLPNAWPPLQEILISGLKRAADQEMELAVTPLHVSSKTILLPPEQQAAIEAKEQSFDFAKTWIKSNYIGYNNSRHMYEKYDAYIPGHYGGGGEYDVQEGFGWTNGVVEIVLNMYGPKFKGILEE